MDPQLQQALMQALGQVLEIIQSAGGAAPPGGDPNAVGPGMDPGMDPGMGDPGMDPSMGDPGEMDPNAGMPGEMPPDDQGMPPTGMAGDGTGGSLHDRVSQLEDHTGLKKSAQGLPMAERIDALERHYLGEEFDGDPHKRVLQLEKAARQDEAPDTIPLDVLIKSAVQEGIRQGLAQQQDMLPDLNRQRYQGSQRRAQVSTVQSDTDLQKAAQAWGYAGDDLDEPATLGDCLAYQWHVAQGGRALPADAMNDDD